MAELPTKIWQDMAALSTDIQDIECLLQEETNVFKANLSLLYVFPVLSFPSHWLSILLALSLT